LRGAAGRSLNNKKHAALGGGIAPEARTHRYAYPRALAPRAPEAMLAGGTGGGRGERRGKTPRVWRREREGADGRESARDSGCRGRAGRTTPWGRTCVGAESRTAARTNYSQGRGGRGGRGGGGSVSRWPPLVLACILHLVRNPRRTVGWRARGERRGRGGRRESGPASSLPPPNSAATSTHISPRGSLLVATFTCSPSSSPSWLAFTDSRPRGARALAPKIPSGMATFFTSATRPETEARPRLDRGSRTD
jgi:hypothetical protein